MPAIYFNAVHLQINSELCIFVKELHYNLTNSYNHET